MTGSGGSGDDPGARPGDGEPSERDGAGARPGDGEPSDHDGVGAEAGDLLPVFRTADLTLLAVVKAALTGAGIPFIVPGEEGLHQFPLGAFGMGFFRRVMGAVIRVPSDRADEAKAFLESFEADPPVMEEAGDEEEDAE